MEKSILLPLVVVLLCSFTTTNTTQNVSNALNATTQLPSAFVIGEHPTTFETLNKEYSTLLLSACEEDMDKAFGTWKELLNEISYFARSKNLDVSGVKMWLKVFWSEDGQIKHIAYDLRPESKNIKKDELTELLEEFVKTRKQTSAKNTSKFSHYGSVSYPLNKI